MTSAIKEEKCEVYTAWYKMRRTLNQALGVGCYGRSTVKEKKRMERETKSVSGCDGCGRIF